MGRRLALAAVLIGGGLLAALVLSAPPAPPLRAPAPKEERPRDPAARLRAEGLPAPFGALLPLARPKAAPEEGDWLAEMEEAGQSVGEHRAACTRVSGRPIYLVPVGALSRDADALVDRLAPLLSAHFQLEVRRLPPLDATVAGRTARAGELGRQWLTTDVLEALLAVRPAGAAAVMGVTEVDLYPDPEWNFVFGVASPEERVAVTSLARAGDLGAGSGLVLERTYATSMHEIGHMFQVDHCIAWECAMNGSNHQAEADALPLEPCPHCLAKLAWATGLEPLARARALAAAFADAGVTRGVEELERAGPALEGAQDGGWR